jgi:hypothetical protein
MKGVRFYKDINGNVCPKEGRTYATEVNGMAVMYKERLFKLLDKDHSEAILPCVSAQKNTSGDGPYFASAVCPSYMRANLIRISEKTAREMFPKLVAFFENSYM